MKKITLLFVMIANLFATTQYQTSKTCKGCHPTIYDEFYSSAHRKASIFEDDIHKAIWDKHPNSKKELYNCNECHTPTDTRITNALAQGTTALPIENKIQTHEAIGCIYCHSIKDIEQHSTPYNKNILVDNNKKRPTLFAGNKDNRNGKILFKEKSSFFGMFKETSGSPYHDIDYTNKDFYTAKMCMGCHAHFENSHGQNVCSVEQNGANNEEQNCITCHMPKIQGSITTIKFTKEHRFHGFAGVRNKPKMLAKYLTFDFAKLSNGFNITVTNLATHNLLIHPLRLGKLNVQINNKSINSVSFARILGKDGKPSMPWNATEVFKNTMLKAKESRVIKYDINVKSGDIIDIEFGYYLVNPKLHKKLNLLNSDKAIKFYVLKTQSFKVK